MLRLIDIDNKILQLTAMLEAVVLSDDDYDPGTLAKLEADIQALRRLLLPAKGRMER